MTRCTSETVVRIRQLVRKGWTGRRIARDIGFSQPGLMKIARRYEIKLPTRSEAMRQSHANETVRERISAGMTAYWADPDNRKRAIAAMNTPQAKENRREGRLEVLQDPARRRAQLAALAAARAKSLEVRRAARTIPDRVLTYDPRPVAMPAEVGS